MKKILLFTALAFGTTLTSQAQSKTEASTSNYYGSNILRVSPLNVYDAGIGVGLSYERLLDREQKVGLILPIDFIFNPNNNSNMNSNSNTYVYFSPGLKFYPAGQKRVTYALGANLLLGMGTRTESIAQVSQNGSIFYITQESKNTRLGVVVNNYLNFNVGKNFVIGLNAGLGVLYLNKYENNINNNYNEGMQPTGQFAFTFGFRF